MTFNELKGLLKTTDGNLSVHARKLEEADYIVCTKSFDGRLPKTEYRLTGTGRRTLERYRPVERVETAPEALLVSLNETGQISWPRMESGEHERRPHKLHRHIFARSGH